MNWMEWLQAAFLGVVQGITEFLPVSSTGHLILFKSWCGLVVDDSFEIFIQAGSVLAVLVEYARRFRRLFHFTDNNGFSGLRGWGLLAMTTFPAGVVGLLAHDWITGNFYGVAPVAVALGIGGIVMLLVEWKLPARVASDGLDGVGWGRALGIGLFQCLALFPGVSRSASTIIGGRVLGLDRKTATEYSFFAAVPTLSLAALYSLYKGMSAGNVTAADLPMFGIGFIVSFVASLLAIRWLLRIISHHTFAPFGWYRILLAVLLLIFL